MPIYEYYCEDCHTVFSFLARTIAPRRRPACPACGRPRLERRVSRFAVTRGRSADADAGAESGDLDEARMERAFEGLADEARGLDENDPRTMGRLMRRLYDGAGLPLNDGMREALRRLEAGEDPDRIEEEMGDLLEPLDASADAEPGASARRRRRPPPRTDPTLYEL